MLSISFFFEVFKNVFFMPLQFTYICLTNSFYLIQSLLKINFFSMKQIILLLNFLFITIISATAQFQVGTQSLSVQDPTRSNRNIGYEVCYPATTAGANTPIAAGQFPVIVFGHGFGINVSEYDVWCDAYASKGYIIAFPTTEGSVLPFPDHEQFSLDMSFLIDHLLGASTPFSGSILGTSAIMGHSMGGGASWSVAATNPNVTTMVTLAAAETNAPVSSIGAAPNITIPTLTLAGTSDCVVMNGGAPIDMYNALPTGPYHAYIDIIGGSHCQFGAASSFSICTTGEFCSGFIPIADQHNQMLTTTCLWMDHYLKGDCQAFLDLQTYISANEGSLHNSMEMGVEPVTSCACASLDLDINFDGTPAQTSWDIVDGSGAVVASGGSYGSIPGNGNTTENTCLIDGCYILNFYDSVNNGMCPFRATASSLGTFVTPGTLITPGSVVATLGTVVTPGLCGNYSLSNADGTPVVSGGGGFGSAESNNFCVVGGVAQRIVSGSVVSEKYVADQTVNTLQINLRPNPVQDYLNIYHNIKEKTEIHVKVIDISGKTMQQHTQKMGNNSAISLDINNLNTGFYLVQLIAGENSITKKFVKQ